MYLLFATALLLLLLFFSLLHFRSKAITHKIYRMHTEEKAGLLTKLLHSSGYSCLPSGDLLSACASSGLPDTEDSAHHIFPGPLPSRPNMALDTLQVRFAYLENIWTMEFHKGQYGFAVWGSILIRHTDNVIPDSQRPLSASYDRDQASLPKPAFSLYSGKEKLLDLSGGWGRLAGFKAVRLFAPADLSMQAALSFSSHDMAMAFVEGLVATGYACDDVCVCDGTVTFTFGTPVVIRNPFRRLKKKAALSASRFWYRVCFLTTRRFTSLSDKILYLYYDLPFLLYKAIPVRKQI